MTSGAHRRGRRGFLPIQVGLLRPETRRSFSKELEPELLISRIVLDPPGPMRALLTESEPVSLHYPLAFSFLSFFLFQIFLITAFLLVYDICE